MTAGDALLETLGKFEADEERQGFWKSKGKTNVGAQLVEVSKDNLSTVDELVDEIRLLYDKGQTREANRLLAIAKKLLYNNAKYQIVVGRVLSDLKQ